MGCQRGGTSIAGASADRLTAEDPGTKLAHRRMQVLELARELGNVSEACRRSGMDRTSFYAWKQRYELHGLEGLKDLPPVHKSHPQTTRPEVVKRMVELALLHPTTGCDRYEALLAAEGERVSSVTIQKILNDKNLGSRRQRWLALEKQHADRVVELTGEQVEFLEKRNPCFKERHAESRRPGELLCADTFAVGNLKVLGRVYLHAVVDCFGSYAFGLLQASKQPEAAIAVLRDDVLPFYAELDLLIGAVLTDDRRPYSRRSKPMAESGEHTVVGWKSHGTKRHPYRLYLEFRQIEHRRTEADARWANGFVERFEGIVREEFFKPKLRGNHYETVEALQADFDAWLLHYNRERPHLGYPNQGRTPWERVQTFVDQRGRARK